MTNPNEPRPDVDWGSATWSQPSQPPPEPSAPPSPIPPAMAAPPARQGMPPYGHPYPVQQFHPAQPGSYQQFQVIPNYLVLSIVAAILFFPAGIVAIVYATQVNTKIDIGDLQGAQAASNSAKIWMIVGLVMGGICAMCGFFSALASA